MEIPRRYKIFGSVIAICVLALCGFMGYLVFFGNNTVNLQEELAKTDPLSEELAVKEIVGHLNHMLERNDINANNIKTVKLDGSHASFYFEGRAYHAVFFNGFSMKQDPESGILHDEEGWFIESLK